MQIPVLPLLAVLSCSLAFEGLVYGQAIAEASFPTLSAPTNPLEVLFGVIGIVFGGIVFFLNLLTFNVPDAPTWVRVPFATIFGGGLFFLILGLIRGSD